jgi:PAS domain S-box-containing protein
LERKPTYEELLRENELFRERLFSKKNDDRIIDFFEFNKAIMFQIDGLNQNILDVNQAAIDFYGYTKEEFTKKNIIDISVISKNTLKKLINKSVQKDNVFIKTKYKLKKGEIRNVEVNTIPF